VSEVGDDGDGDEETDAGERSDADPAAASAEFVVSTDAGSDGDAEWRRELEAAGELTASAVENVVARHDRRGVRAVEAVSEGRVKRYRDFTVVVGYEDEYVVEDGGCTCKDSSYNLDPEDPNQRCWHVIATAIAERIGEVDYHDMWYSDVREFL
jgi:predicted nucleic acid-binding Zn finger protein